MRVADVLEDAGQAHHAAQGEDQDDGRPEHQIPAQVLEESPSHVAWSVQELEVRAKRKTERKISSLDYCGSIENVRKDMHSASLSSEM